MKMIVLMWSGNPVEVVEHRHQLLNTSVLSKKYFKDGGLTEMLKCLSFNLLLIGGVYVCKASAGLCGGCMKK